MEVITMTFWDRFYELCVKNGTKPNPVAKELGISSGAVTKWKNGSIPDPDMLIKISNKFDVSIDYLLTGKTSQSEPSQTDEITQRFREKYNHLSETDKERLESILDVLLDKAEKEASQDQSVSR